MTGREGVVGVGRTAATFEGERKWAGLAEPAEGPQVRGQYDCPDR